MKIVFMGSPDFAVPSLEALVEARFKVGLVVTQPDRPAGQGAQDARPPRSRPRPWSTVCR